jgi:hypothetical protein
VSAHLTDDEIVGLRTGALPVAGLLEADDHLSGCAPCLARALSLAPAARAADDLREALRPAASHLSDEDVQAYALGGLSADARAAADAHTAACAVCAEQVRELAAWVPPRRAPRVALAVAAAVLLALASAAAWRIAHRDASRAPGLPGFAALPSAQQQQVRAAIAAGVASPPPLLAELAGEPEVLMGAAPEPPPFALVSPVATAVVTDRPHFAWHPLGGWAAYTVAVSDERLRPVATSGALAATEWTPEVALPRGRTYVWQVTARRGDATVVVPSAPAPAARFLVLDAETAGRLEALDAAHPGSHLLLGIVSLQAGARDDARRHLLAVPATDPDAALARRTLDALGR